MFLLVYIYDILMTGSDKHATEALSQKLNKQFTLKGFGNLSYFLGIQVYILACGVFHLSQNKIYNRASI